MASKAFQGRLHARVGGTELRIAERRQGSMPEARQHLGEVAQLQHALLYLESRAQSA